MSIRPPEYKPPPRRAYTNLGWIFAALTGPATLLAVWIYCAVTYGFLLGFGLGWIPALVLALLVVVATIFLWPLAVVAVLNKSTALVDAAIYKAIQGLERAKAEEREFERWLAAQKAKEKGGALKKLKN